MNDEQKQVTLTSEQLEHIVQRAIGAALDQRDRIDHETHKLDHEWVKMQRAREKTWNDNIELAKKSAIGFLTVGAISLLIKGFAFIGGLVLAYISARGGTPPTGGS
jgi:preprotein translocase subunit Sss1